MKAEFKIKKQIILNTYFGNNEKPPFDSLDTEEQVEDAWYYLYENDFAFSMHDVTYDFRHSGEDTKIPARDWSRYYDSKEVGVKLDDGSWVGWTFWSGGGKHGDPDGIDWIEDAYYLNVLEEEKLVIVRTFSLGASKDEDSTSN